MTSTTLHWFGERRLGVIFGACAQALVPGGFLANADHVQPDDPRTARLALDLAEAERARLFQRTGAMTWEAFWEALGAELGVPDYYDAVASPAWGPQDGPEAGYEYSQHVRLLHEAGFRRVGVLWRHLSDALVIAER